MVCLTLEVRLPQQITEKGIFEVIDTYPILRDARCRITLDGEIFARNQSVQRYFVRHFLRAPRHVCD